MLANDGFGSRVGDASAISGSKGFPGRRRRDLSAPDNVPRLLNSLYGAMSGDEIVDIE
jgi:hypothetical protein